jgi:hypothetical protein
MALTPETYEDLRRQAQDFVDKRKKLGLITTPDEERIDRQAFPEALMELWPQFEPLIRKAISQKRLEIPLR